MGYRLRHLWLAAYLIAAIGAGSEAFSQVGEAWVDKLDLSARQLALAETPEQRTLAASQLSAIYDLTVRDDGEVRIGLLIRLDDPIAAAALEAETFRLETLAGNIAVGTIDATRLPAIARLESVQTIEVSRYVEVLNDLANEAINTTAVHAGTGLPQGYRGEGVIVGVFDTGIDFTHPDFSDADGTRIEYLLEYLPDDQNQPPEAQIEWTAHDIDNNPEQVTQRDIHGHGTHVAGSAVGGGNASPDLHGAAPASRMIVVKGSRTATDPNRPHVFSERDMINGTAYIFERAADLGMPAVINFSIGSPGPPLDGTANVNVAMSALTGEGRIIVFAAGNDGARRLHWGTNLEEGVSATMVPRYGSFSAGCCGELMVVDTWYDPGAIESVTVAARDTLTTSTLASLTVPVGQQTADFQLLMSTQAEYLGWVAIDATVTAHPDNGDGVIRVLIANMHFDDLHLNDYIWSITLDAASDGRADAWLLASAMGQFAEDNPGIPGFVPGDNLMTLNRLAAANDVVVAGSFTTRNEWVQASGNPIVIDAPIGARTRFSSLGPTRDGRVRPDVLAPGAYIVSALSSDASFGWSFLGEPKYAVGAGTSMAAPFLSGTVALMLQVDPTLNPDEVREIIRSTAITDSHTGAVPNPEYGFGKLDAFGAVQATLAAVGIEPGNEVLATMSLEAPYPNPARTGAFLAFHLPQSGHAKLTLYDLLGREVQRISDGPLPAGPHQVRIDGSSLASGVYLIVLSAGDERRAQRLVFID